MSKDLDNQYGTYYYIAGIISYGIGECGTEGLPSVHTQRTTLNGSLTAFNHSLRRQCRLLKFFIETIKFSSNTYVDDSCFFNARL